MHQLNHRHLIVTAFLRNPPTTVVQGESWLTELVSIVGMQILMDAKAIYCEDLGNEGLTGVVGLSTSHSSFHSWSSVEKPYIQMDLYSCKMFDEKEVLRHIDKFGIIEAQYMMINRNLGALSTSLSGVYYGIDNLVAE